MEIIEKFDWVSLFVQTLFSVVNFWYIELDHFFANQHEQYTTGCIFIYDDIATRYFRKYATPRQSSEQWWRRRRSVDEV
jgi:hypothetical protein